MHPNDFVAFKTLLADIHLQAFGEPICKLTHAKSTTLSWLIFEATGEMLSYKTLNNYFAAAQLECPDAINPNLSTLVILASFATGQTARQQPPLVTWQQFRARIMNAA